MELQKFARQLAATHKAGRLVPLGRQRRLLHASGYPLAIVNQCPYRFPSARKFLKLHYPPSLLGIGKWAKANLILVSEAEFRFAQFGILRAIADSRDLSEKLVFKGGNALDFVWLPNRSTRDLDFSCGDNFIAEESFTDHLGRSLAAAGRKLDIGYRLQKIERRPALEDATFPALKVHIGYALPADRNNQLRLARGELSKAVIEMDLSLNEVICATVPCDFQSKNQLLVSTVEDIVAEKLRSLLQQPIRNRYRRQDVLDICSCLRKYPQLNRDMVREFLIRKSESREISVTDRAFHQEEVRSRANENYEGLRETTRSEWIPFDEAFEEVLKLVSQLELPISQSA